MILTKPDVQLLLIEQYAGSEAGDAAIKALKAHLLAGGAEPDWERYPAGTRAFGLKAFSGETRQPPQASKSPMDELMNDRRFADLLEAARCGHVLQTANGEFNALVLMVAKLKQKVAEQTIELAIAQMPGGPPEAIFALETDKHGKGTWEGQASRAPTIEALKKTWGYRAYALGQDPDQASPCPCRIVRIDTFRTIVEELLVVPKT